MLGIFFDKTCNIYSITNSYDTNGELEEVTNTIYSGIACDFYKGGRNKLKENGFTIDGKNYAYTLVLQGDKTDVRVGHIVELIDNNLGSYGTYIIDDVLAYRNINGLIDNFEILVSERIKA